jgi:FAD binding domain
MAWDSGGDIDGGVFVYHTDDGDIHVSGKIDGGSTVVLVSIHGSITVDDKVDGQSNVSLTAATQISVGGKIDQKSIVVLVCNNGPVTIGGKMDDHSSLSVMSSGDISLGVGAGLGGGDRKIDGSSTAVLVSNHGSITIGGKVDQNSHVLLVAQEDISIGVIAGGGDGKIDGNSHVDATSGGVISLGNKIGGGQGGHTSVDFKACDGIAIADNIEGGSTARLLTGTGSISVSGDIHDGATSVAFWPPGSLQVAGGINDGAAVNAAEWAALEPLCQELQPVVGHWWQNWPRTFGYVCENRSFPRSLAEISQAILSANIDQNVKAAGGGWSFSDAALPFRTQAEVDRVSTLLRGASGTQDLSRLLQQINDVTSTPMDLLPEAVASAVAFSTQYDQPSTTQRTSTGALLPGAITNVQIIDTRSLASSLQCELDAILSGPAKRKREGGQLLFHVEAGITMADLDQLLDHQNPRMAIQASGGSPGATLAGTLSTATHGGEFRWPLLVDMVRAIHLVGPGGEEWWIEGEESIADLGALHHQYPKLDAAHFISGHWNGIPGLTAQDVLNAVIVSMGTMGVIYSVVLEVVPQFGLQQIVTSTNWSALLSMANTTEDLLRQGDVQANEAVLGVILDGSINGTAIAEPDNVYADLAINPFNKDCWITNRRRTPVLPVDGNSPATTVGDYFSSLNEPLSTHAVDTVQNSHLAGRVFDFLGWATDIPGIVNVVGQASALLGFLTRFPDLFTAALATINVQAVANTLNAAGNPDRGQQFLGDVLTGFFRALQGSEPGRNSDRTDIAYKVGAIGWPDGGLPGRGLEIALDPKRAFSFLQTILFDDVLQNTMAAGNKPLIGYISIRICPPTMTLMGMQQYSPYSVMTEVVGYRSPEANALMDLIQQKVLDQNKNHGLNAMLHWGLENQMMTAADLTQTPLHELIRPASAFTRLEAFRAVRKFLTNNKPPVFDNNFVHRLNL